MIALPLLLLLLGVAAAASAATTSVLVLSTQRDDVSSVEGAHSLLWDQLRARGHSVRFGSMHTHEVMAFKELVADHVVLVAHRDFAKWSKPVPGAQTLIDYVNAGGNLLVLTEAASAPVADLARAFGVQFLRQSSLADSHGSRGESLSLDPATTTPLHHVISGTDMRGSIVYTGVGHVHLASNPLVSAVLCGNPTTYLTQGVKVSGPSSVSAKQAAEKVLSGAQVSLVSVLQARNNARVAFAGSINMFSDTAMKDGKNGNAEFASQLTGWVFQQRSVLRTKAVNYHLPGASSSPAYFRKGEEFVYEIQLEQLTDGAWKPFRLPAGDKIQLEVVMLDPYQRLDLVPANNTAGTYVTVPGVRMPDQHGVYTLKVMYHRRGLSFVTEKATITVQPPRHNEYPRFLSAAYPYYAGAWSMAAAFLLFCAAFLYSKDPVAVVDKKQ